MPQILIQHVSLCATFHFPNSHVWELKRSLTAELKRAQLDRPCPLSLCSLHRSRQWALIRMFILRAAHSRYLIHRVSMSAGPIFSLPVRLSASRPLSPCKYVNHGGRQCIKLLFGKKSSPQRADRQSEFQLYRLSPAPRRKIPLSKEGDLPTQKEVADVQTQRRKSQNLK